MGERLIDILLRIVVNGVAIGITAALLPGVSIAQHNVGTILLLGLVIGVINGFVKPILRFLTMPISFMTLGLFHFVLNALMLLLAGAIIPSLHINNFFDALIGGVIMGIIAGVLEWLVKRAEPAPERRRVA
jgi:putative membrane protein